MNDDFTAKFLTLVPLPKAIIDTQVRSWAKSMGDEVLAMLKAQRCEEDEIRNNLEEVIVAGLRGLVYTIGDSFYSSSEERKPPGAFTQSYVLTHEKCLLPDIAEAIFSCRLWPVEDKKAFLAHTYDWYVSCVAKAPEHFRRDEWELVVDAAGELLVRLTGKKKVEPPPHAKRERARIVRYGAVE